MDHYNGKFSEITHSLPCGNKISLVHLCKSHSLFIKYVHVCNYIWFIVCNLIPVIIIVKIVLNNLWIRGYVAKYRICEILRKCTCTYVASVSKNCCWIHDKQQSINNSLSYLFLTIEWWIYCSVAVHSCLNVQLLFKVLFSYLR